MPNGKLIDGSVVNWTVEDTSVRIELTVGVAYGSDVALTRQLLLDAALADPRVLRSPTPLVRFDDFGDSALTFTLNPWIVDPDTRFIVASDLRFRIDRLFHDNGVEIAFPQQDVHLRTGDGTIRVALENGYTVRDEAGNVLVDPTPGDHRTAG